MTAAREGADRVREAIAELRQRQRNLHLTSGEAHARALTQYLTALEQAAPALLDHAEAGLAAKARAGTYIHRSVFEGEEQRRADAVAELRQAQARIAELEAERDRLQGAYDSCKAGRAELFGERNHLRAECARLRAALERPDG